MIPGRDRRAGRAIFRVAPAVAVIALAGLAYGIWLFSVQLGVGWYRDDGVYVLTAHSIAEGRGPRLEFLPGAPYATKYPLFWPALLSGVLSLAGATLRELTGPLVVAPNALFIPLALLAYGFLLHRSWRLPTAVVALLVISLALSPALLEFARFPMSECLFIALSVGAIALADGGVGGVSGKAEIAAAVLAVAAMHTRLAGVTLVAALFVAFLIRRHIAPFVFTGILAAVSIGGWLSFLRNATAADAAAHASRVLAFDLGYGGDWASLVVKPGEIPGHAGQLIFYATHTALGAIYPMALLRQAAEGGSALPIGSLVAGFLVLAAVGLWGRMRGSGGLRPLARAETWYLPMALILILLWPTSTRRLLVPLLPWLLALPVLGLAFLLRSPRALPIIGASGLAGLAIVGLPYNIPDDPGVFMVGGAPVRVAPLERALGALRALPPSARIGSPMAPLVYLHTGRLAVETWVGPKVTGAGMKGREMRTFYVTGGEPDMGRAFEAVAAALREYPALGVKYGFSRTFPGRDYFLVVASRLPGARVLFSSEEYELIALPAPRARLNPAPR